MRTRDMLKDIDDVALLMKYLYMDESNRIVVKNRIGVPLEISMNEDGYTMQKNLNFPEIPAHQEDYQVPVWLGIIDQLKEQPKQELKDVKTGERIRNRWDEIKCITQVQLSMNR